MRPRRKQQRMYAVSLKGRGIVAGTVGDSRTHAISLFQFGHRFLKINGVNWSESKRKGYRTVKVAVRIV